MGRFIALLYGLISYLAFFGTILYAIGFVAGLGVPKTIDSGPVVPTMEALIVNLLLMSIFAVQHSVMARKEFKAWWTQFVPKSVERSTYVLLSSLALILLFWQWRPMPAVIWQIDTLPVAGAMLALSLVGWVIVFTSSFLINHFELFGLQQVANNLTGVDAGAALPHAAVLQFCAAPDLSRLHHRVLGERDHDGRTPAICGSDHGLYPGRHRAGRARSDRPVRR
jgi:protein-S-isoprenylcysteine O-methyltransferase Ste14